MYSKSFSAYFFVAKNIFQIQPLTRLPLTKSKNLPQFYPNSSTSLYFSFSLFCCLDQQTSSCFLLYPVFLTYRPTGLRRGARPWNRANCFLQGCSPVLAHRTKATERPAPKEPPASQRTTWMDGCFFGWICVKNKAIDNFFCVVGAVFSSFCGDFWWRMAWNSLMTLVFSCNLGHVLEGWL